jgi:hypothetical protein
MANSTLRHYFLKLVNTRTKKPLNDDSGDYQVYTAGSPARATIYNAAGTQLTQEVVGTSFISRDMTDGTLEFYTDRSVSSVDVSILTAKGRAFFLKGVTASQHRVDVDPERAEYLLVAAINDKASSTTVRPLGFQLRKGMVVKDVLVKVTTAFTGAAAASNQYNIGRSGDIDGFLDVITLSSAGFKDSRPVLSTTGLVKSRLGADLATYHASSTGGVDFYVRKSYIAVTGVASNNLAVRRQTAATLTASFTGQAGKAYIYYMYTLLPTEAADTSF